MAKEMISLTVVDFQSRWETSIKSSYLEHKLLMSFPWWAPLNWTFPDKIFETPSWEQEWTPVPDELLPIYLRSPQQEGHISRYFTATINTEIQLIDDSSFFEYIPNHQICFKMNETLRNLLRDNFSFQQSILQSKINKISSSSLPKCGSTDQKAPFRRPKNWKKEASTWL